MDGSWVDSDEASETHGIGLTVKREPGRCHAIVLAVAHGQFAALGEAGISASGRPDGVLYDIKSLLPNDAVNGRA